MHGTLKDCAVGTTRHRPRFGGLGILVLTAALFGTPALADDGLSTGATSRYVIDAKAAVLKVDVTLELRNTTPDQGNRYFYYNFFTVPVPAGAENLRASSGGSTLKVRLSDSEDPSTALARISFPDLRHGRSRTIRLTYTVPGEKPRAADSTRVGPGYATFSVNGFGDPGRNTVQVVAPTSMTFDATSEDFTASDKGATTTHTVSSSDPDGFWAVVSLRDPANSRKATVDVPGTSLELHGYQDDARWTEFVQSRSPPVCRSWNGSPGRRGPVASSGSGRMRPRPSRVTTAGSTPATTRSSSARTSTPT